MFLTLQAPDWKYNLHRAPPKSEKKSFKAFDGLLVAVETNIKYSIACVCGWVYGCNETGPLP